jgi:hypothetical protein
VFVAIVTLSCLISVIWAIEVPFFQEPDESAHFDYAISIATAHHLLWARTGEPGTDVHPYTRYLEDASNFRAVRYSRDARPPVDYGSKEYYERINSGAPRAATFDVADHFKLPYVLSVYPFGFYALEAVVISLTGALTNDSIVQMYFAARLACVELLALFLILNNMVLAELRLPTWTRLSVLATIGFFPLSSWVFAYIQPDNLAAVLLALVTYLGLLARNNIKSNAIWSLTGLALALLAATKVQYFLASGLSACAALLAYGSSAGMRRAELARKWATVVIPPVLVGIFARSIAAYPVLHGRIQGNAFAAWSDALGRGPNYAATYILSNLTGFYGMYFGLGQGLVTYWGSISWLMTRIVIGSWSTYILVYFFILALTSAVAILMLVRQTRVVARLANVAIRRSFWAAAREATGDTVLTSYGCFILILGVISVLTDGAAVNQGRYFLPFVAAGILCAVHYGPQVLPRRLKLPFSMVMLLALLSYSVVDTFYGFRALDTRFYIPSKIKFKYEASVNPDPYGTCGPHFVGTRQQPLFVVKRPASIRICGWALDSRIGGPARGLLVSIDDNKPVRARYGIGRSDAVVTLFDEGFYRSGFEISIPTANLELGLHQVNFFVLEHDRPEPYPSPQHMVFRVE